MVNELGELDKPGKEPKIGEVVAAFGLALAFVVLTRGPVARPSAYDFDEVGYLETIGAATLPMHHTLFLASAGALGRALGDPYRGFVVLDMAVSALALVAAWWWLRSLVGPRTAASATLALGCGPVFWAYGAMAGNYTAIPAVGSLLLGIAWRGRVAPRPWHPFAAAAALAIGAGYRQDIGTFWLPVFAVILWQHRGRAALHAGLLFVVLNLAWFAPMLREAGGWSAYRQASGEFAYKAGYLNSAWHVGLIDGPARYAVKAGMALLWTLGPGLLVVPRGVARLRAMPAGGRLGALLALSVVPAFGSHLTVHFGVPGYAFHHLPALLALLALGIGPTSGEGQGQVEVEARASRRCVALAATLAALFLLYPTDYDRPGLRGDFDLAFARHTRVGLRTPPPVRDPTLWRTVNSQELPGESGRRTRAPRTVADLLGGIP